MRVLVPHLLLLPLFHHLFQQLMPRSQPLPDFGARTIWYHWHLHSTIWEDNVGALTLAHLELPRMTPRSKHIATKYHWFRQFVGSKFFVQKIDTLDQIGDLFTKGLGPGQFEKLRKLMIGWWFYFLYSTFAIANFDVSLLSSRGSVEYMLLNGIRVSLLDPRLTVIIKEPHWPIGFLLHKMCLTFNIRRTYLRMPFVNLWYFCRHENIKRLL